MYVYRGVCIWSLNINTIIIFRFFILLFTFVIFFFFFVFFSSFFVVSYDFWLFILWILFRVLSSYCGSCNACLVRFYALHSSYFCWFVYIFVDTFSPFIHRRTKVSSVINNEQPQLQQQQQPTTIRKTKVSLGLLLLVLFCSLNSFVRVTCSFFLFFFFFSNKKYLRDVK